MPLEENWRAFHGDGVAANKNCVAARKNWRHLSQPVARAKAASPLKNWQARKLERQKAIPVDFDTKSSFPVLGGANKNWLAPLEKTGGGGWNPPKPKVAAN